MDAFIRKLDIFDEWELFIGKSFYKTLNIEKDKIKYMSSEKEICYALRVILNGKVGFASSSKIDKLIDMAYKMAKISDEELREFPSGKMKKVEGIYDKRVEKVDEGFFIEGFEVMKTKSAATIAVGLIETEIVERKILNSSGIDLTEKGTFCSVYVEMVYGRGSAYEFDAKRNINIDFEFIADNAGHLAVEDNKAEKMERKICSIALSPLAVHQLLYYTLYPAFNAENVAKGRSVLANKIGERVFKDITIIDDSSLPNGLYSFGFDDEGIEAKRKEIFSSGVLKTFISDYRHSIELGIEPSGNSIREDFNNYPKAQPSNVILEFEKGSGEADFYIHSFIGAHTSNPISGDFSLECMNAFYKGKAVRGAMLYGNIYDLINKISYFGKDVRQVENTISPTIYIEEFEVKA